MQKYKESFITSELCTDTTYEYMSDYLSISNVKTALGIRVIPADLEITSDGSLEYIYDYIITPYCDDTTGRNCLIEVDNVVYKKILTRDELLAATN